MADIDMLNIDELLIIVNLLSLYDKLMAMRVCKKWNRIVRDTYAWKVIDFRDKGPVITANYRTFWNRYVAEPGQNVLTFRDSFIDWELQSDVVKRWEFSRNPRDVLSFLGIFAGVALREIYLTVTSGEIVEFLRRTCPNIITFYSSPSLTWKKMDACIDIDDVINKRLYIPVKLKRLGLFEINSYCHESYANYFWAAGKAQYCQNAKLNERILSSVASDCIELRSIFLSNFEITSTCMQNLVKILSLREIELFSCGCYRGRLSRCGCCHYTDDPSEFDNILTNSIGNLRTLTSLRIVHNSPSNNLSTFLGCIGEWENLLELSLIHVTFSEEAFEKMTSGLENLQKLELVTPSVTSHVVTLIGIHAMKLKSLQLIKEGLYSGKSLMSLCHNHTLEILEVQYRRGPSRESECQWLRRVFSMLETLPRINHVKLWGQYVAQLYNRGTFPIIQSAEIEAIEKEEFKHKKQNKLFNKKSFERIFKR
ncbi:uncharacterized protein [Amphiura filiformis]|uniref:uncharacterized protein n=1 Tax=Amphiura filiformis TaxID=82378 RepID=UPI003B210203